ncbi:MAG TPA: hypothetical protein VFX92_05225 [Candidatus Krumholzibacteria bacterium]|nr:hypothetical protein [Candidatus Krumholzibacteria bacterium]
MKMKTAWIVAMTLAVASPGFVTRANAQSWSQFDHHWHDGKAELDGYHLVVSRYGQDRKATAVMVFVTEPFSEAKRVKVDDPTANPADTFDALKLNLVRDFQTGIYDYNTMLSVFVRSATMEPVKVSFSSSEWCGHVYSELIFQPKAIRGQYLSYFEGESGPVNLGRPTGGITEDELFIALRGLRHDFMAAGETKTLPYLPGSFYSRLTHKPLEWTQAVITRAKGTESVTVPAGTMESFRYDVKIADGRAGVFYIENEYPHRIVQWSLAPDVRGELTGSARLPYWMAHAEGDEKYLKDLGIAPRQ